MAFINWNKSEITAQELYAVREDDFTGLMLDSITAHDIINDDDNETGVIVFDALIIENQLFERKANVFQKLMKGKSQAVDVVSYQVTEPFKRNGTLNRAIIFELDDGQTVSVYLHNPDVTDKTVQPTDNFVSYKWMLNKRDITILVAPEKGSDISPREVTTRIMKLAGKNSEAFKKANANRAAKLSEIKDLTAQVEAKEAELAQLQNELSYREHMTDAEKAEQTERLGGVVPSQNNLIDGDIITFKRQLDDEVTYVRQGTYSIDYLVSNRSRGLTKYLNDNPDVLDEHNKRLIAEEAIAHKVEPVVEPTPEQPQVANVKIRDAISYLQERYFGGNANAVVVYAQGEHKTVNNNKQAITRATNEFLNKYGEYGLLFSDSLKWPSSASDALESLGVTVDKSDPIGFVPEWLKIGDVYNMSGDERMEAAKVLYFSGLLMGWDEPVVKLASGHTSYDYKLSDFEKMISEGKIVKLEGALSDYERKNELFSLYVNSKGNEVLRVIKVTEYGGSVTYDVKTSSSTSFGDTFEQAKKAVIREKEYVASMKLKSGYDFLNEPTPEKTDQYEADRTYLQSVINGNEKEAMKDPTFADNLTAVYERVKDDEAMLKLANDAITYYMDYMQKVFQNGGVFDAVEMDKKDPDCDNDDDTYDGDDDFDADAEWDACSGDDDEDVAMDGDFVGHPFRGNQYVSQGHASSSAVKATKAAKRAHNSGDKKAVKNAHKSAAYAHKAAAVGAQGKAKKYHNKMAKFHAKHAGMAFDNAEGGMA